MKYIFIDLIKSDSLDKDISVMFELNTECSVTNNSAFVNVKVKLRSNWLAVFLIFILQ